MPARPLRFGIKVAQIFSCPTPYSAAGARSVWEDVVMKLRA